MTNQTIDIEVARAAVRRVMQQLAGDDPRAECDRVADEAVRILAANPAGQVTMLRAAEAVKQAIQSMGRAG